VRRAPPNRVDHGLRIRYGVSKDCAAGGGYNFAMKPLRSFFSKFSNVSALLLLVACAGSLTDAQTKEPKKFYKSYRLLPTQRLVSGNKEFRDVFVHSEFPISVRVGDCYSPSTVDLHCSGSPSDVLVTDQRKGPPTKDSEKNLVEITFVED
jgi:hypothetical protein